ncbi:MAG: lysyl oxidase family protein [Actinomycetes bacterium]
MTTNARPGSRDHLWLLAGAAAVGVAAALTAVVAAGDPEQATPSPATTSPSVQQTTSTKPDRLPPTALMPNMRVLPAEEMGLAGRGDRRVLRFASVLTNAGAGPLQVSPVPVETCPPGQRYVEQRVYLDADADGAFDRRADRETVALPGACMVFHPLHDHWHFDSSAGYALTPVGTTEPIVSRDKVSFCLRDSEPLKGASERHRRTYAECARNRRQGISVGWADRYDASLAGQRLALPRGFIDDVYCLRIEVDPFDLLREADEEDNSSATVVRIAGRDVRREAALTC